MPIAQLDIRQAAQVDTEALVSLRACLLDSATEASYASRDAEEGRLWKVAYRQWLSPVLEGVDHARILVATNGNEVVGCATGIIDPRPPAPDCLSGWCGWVQSVVVSPRFRRLGIAQRLMRGLLQWFKARNVAKVLLEATPGAEALYRKLGFTPGQERLLSFSGGRS